MSVSYLEDAVKGRIRVLIPYTVIFGTHYVLTRFYNVAPHKANVLLQNLLSSERVIWYGGIRPQNVTCSLENTEKYDLDAWDGYLLHLMEANHIRIIYTLDMSHFGKIEGIKPVNPVPKRKMQELHVFLEENL